jgi:hypothetical protein
MRFKSYRWLIVLFTGLLVIYGITALLSTYVENEIKKRIHSFHGTVSSLDINLFTRSIQLKNITWTSVAGDLNQTPHFVSLRTISAEGICLYELLLHKKLLINNLILDSGTIRYNTSIKQTVRAIPGSKYRSFAFKHILLTDINTQIRTDTLTRFSASVNCSLGDALIKIDSLNDPSYSLKTIDGFMKKINITRYNGMYSGTIARLSFNSIKQQLIIDSAVLIPYLGKYEFARHLGKQIARIDLFIPQLTVAGLELAGIIDSSFVASKIEIRSFDLVAFKDKRIPFTRTENIPLPMVVFLNIPFLIKIDSVVISDSRITVEEFAEHGIKPGTISFEDINATISQLDNRQPKNDHSYSRLNASCLLMSSGQVKALFQFPLDGSSVYTAKGSVSNMPFKALNPVLTSMANVRVESGYLKDFTFDFVYSEFTSKGNINIDYKDLQLIGLNTNKRSTNEIKTFILNAFVKNHRSKSITPTIKNGIINIERDRKRYIFNVWWRSILDGLKSGILG